MTNPSVSRWQEAFTKRHGHDARADVYGRCFTGDMMRDNGVAVISRWVSASSAAQRGETVKRLTGNTHQAGSVHGHDDRLLLLSSEQLQGGKKTKHFSFFMSF